MNFRRNSRSSDSQAQNESLAGSEVMRDPKVVTAVVPALLVTAVIESVILFAGLSGGNADNAVASPPESSTPSDSTPTTTPETPAVPLAPIFPITYLRDETNPDFPWEVKANLRPDLTAQCAAYKMSASAFEGADTAAERIQVMIDNKDALVPSDATGQTVFPLNVSSKPEILQSVTVNDLNNLYTLLSQPGAYPTDIQPFTWVSSGITGGEEYYPSCSFEDGKDG